MIRAVFFDRDGTLINEPEDMDVNTWEKFKVLPGLSELVRVQNLGYKIFVISNQEGIGEGRLTQEFYNTTNDKLLEILKGYGVVVEKIYTCAHARVDNCSCRKPKRGLIDQTLIEYQIDLPNSWIVGDRPSDVVLGQAVGMRTIFVRSLWHTLPKNIKPNFVVDDLNGIIKYIIG